MHTSEQGPAGIDDQPRRQRRRRYSAEFKARVITACQQPGVSVAAIALQNGLNANLLRRWVLAAERAGIAAPVPTIPNDARPVDPVPSFLPVTVSAPVQGSGIRVEVRRGDLQISINWPSRDAAACVLWLRELLG